MVGRHIDRGDKCRCVQVSNRKIEDVGAALSRRSFWQQETSFALTASDHISLYVYMNATMFL